MDFELAPTLRVGVLTTAFSFDPHQPFDYGTSLLVEQVFEPLYRMVGSPARPEPLAASELPQPHASAERSVVVPLRDGLRFSDGQLISPAHAAVAIDRALADTPGIRVRAADRGIRFDLAIEDRQLATRLTNPWWSLARRAGGQWIGTGPYALHEDSTPERAILVANPHYRGELPVHRVVMQTYPTDEELGRAIERGELDFVNQVPAGLSDLGGMYAHTRPGHSNGFLWIDTQRLPEVELRRALLAALDRRRLTELGHGDDAESFVARGFLPPGWSSYRDRLRPDPALARRVLGGRELELRLLAIWGARPYLPRPLAVAKAIQTMLGRFGVSVVIDQASDALDYVDRATGGRYDLILGGWNADSPDPISFLEAMFDSGMVPEQNNPIGCNFSRWRDALLDGSIRAMRTESGPEVEEGAMKLVEDAALVLPINYGAVSVLSSPRLDGVEVDGRGMVRFANCVLRDLAGGALGQARRRAVGMGG